MNLEQRIKKHIREVPDFPTAGISFKDITPLLLLPDLCEEITEALAEPYKNEPIDLVTGIESRGFIFGMLLAKKLNTGFLPIRKKGKLPSHTLQQSYKLEYGSAVIELHKDDIKKGQRVLIHDDLLATGGTAMAANELLKKGGCITVGFSFLVELDFLESRKQFHKMGDYPIHSLTRY